MSNQFRCYVNTCLVSVLMMFTGHTSAAVDAWIAPGVPAMNKSVRLTGGFAVTGVNVTPAPQLLVNITGREADRVRFTVQAPPNALQGVTYNLAFKAGPVTRKNYKVYVARRGEMRDQTVNIQAGEQREIRVSGTNMGSHVNVKFEGPDCGALRHGPAEDEVYFRHNETMVYETRGTSFTMHVSHGPTNRAVDCELSVFDGFVYPGNPDIRSFVGLKYRGLVVVNGTINQDLGTEIAPVNIIAPQPDQSFRANSGPTNLTFMRTPGVDLYAVTCTRYTRVNGRQQRATVTRENVYNDRNRNDSAPHDVRVPTRGALTAGATYTCSIVAERRQDGARVRSQASVNFRVNSN